MANEVGDVSTQVLYGVTLVNYGTTYSIDDVYTEVTYTYVALDATPLLPRNVHMGVSSDHPGATPRDLLDEHYPYITESKKLYTVRRGRVDSLLHAKGFDDMVFWANEVDLEHEARRRIPPSRWSLFRYY